VLIVVITRDLNSWGSCGKRNSQEITQMCQDKRPD
jgi:hypothetical protein